MCICINIPFLFAAVLNYFVLLKSLLQVFLFCALIYSQGTLVPAQEFAQAYIFPVLAKKVLKITIETC